MQHLLELAREQRVLNVRLLLLHGGHNCSTVTLRWIEASSCSVVAVVEGALLTGKVGLGVGGALTGDEGRTANLEGRTRASRWQWNLVLGDKGGNGTRIRREQLVCAGDLLHSSPSRHPRRSATSCSNALTQCLEPRIGSSRIIR